MINKRIIKTMIFASSVLITTLVYSEDTCSKKNIQLAYFIGHHTSDPEYYAPDSFNPKTSFVEDPGFKNKKLYINHKHCVIDKWSHTVIFCKR